MDRKGIERQSGGRATERQNGVHRVGILVSDREKGRERCKHEALDGRKEGRQRDSGEEPAQEGTGAANSRR